MEIVLLAITVISLVAAFIMGATTWRLSREARARSAARVAALAAAAGEPEGVSVGESRTAPWAPARVSAFPTEAPDGVPDRRPPAESHDRRPSRPAASPETASLSDGFLGGAAAPATGSRQRSLAIAACVLFVAIVTGGYWSLYGSSPGSVSAAASTVTASPLELVSLRHERHGAKLSITGLVRNPQGGAPVDRLTAVVFLFDQLGGFVTSARAGIDFRMLAPGDESPFVIALDAPTNVSRYRVSFRNDAGVVAHVDRRSQEPIARELP